ncbi:unnamed protein product [Rhizophagus irregularis]|nr:unnamed protein product [Rhizophagus irregularis]
MFTTLRTDVDYPAKVIYLKIKMFIPSDQNIKTKIEDFEVSQLMPSQDFNIMPSVDINVMVKSSMHPVPIAKLLHAHCPQDPRIDPTESHTRIRRYIFSPGQAYVSSYFTDQHLWSILMSFRLTTPICSLS